MRNDEQFRIHFAQETEKSNPASDVTEPEEDILAEDDDEDDEEEDDAGEDFETDEEVIE